ncbi:MAG TPA: M24 family metallopeptidase, partial [Solirubrobacterales bacterium]|nr:M24 family metallopeptidase [Solirubrobacterales bacterium]
LVVFDMGARLDGYCSDGTRTFAVGEPGERAREVYETVREAQAKALDAVRAGIGGEGLDGVAREAIAAAGHGERFGHGLGHGVGLEVHEAPRLSPRSEDVLAAGEVVTVEPGVYLPGELGVRIEDLVAVEESGCRNLSGLPKELQIAD